MTSRYVISKYVSSMMYFLKSIFLVIIMTIEIGICLIGELLSPIARCIVKRIEVYKSNKILHYVVQKGGWMMHKESGSWNWWFIRRDKLYCDEQKIMEIVQDHVNSTTKEKYKGCTLIVRIYHLVKTKKICEVAFRIEKEGKTMHDFRLSDKEMSMLEYNIRRLPMKEEYISNDECYAQTIAINL